MDQLKQKLELANEEAIKILPVKIIAEKTKIPPAYILLGTLLILVLVVALGYGSSFISRLIGVVYPTIKSIEAMESKDNTDDDQQWLTYWAIYGFFIFIDEFAWFILAYIPFYYFGKVCFLIWLFNPATKGASVIYTSAVRPLFNKYKVQITDFLNVINSLAQEGFAINIEDSNANKQGKTTKSTEGTAEEVKKIE